jgi:hypothetical protein
MKNLATKGVKDYSGAAPTLAFAVCPAQERKERT